MKLRAAIPALLLLAAAAPAAEAKAPAGFVGMTSYESYADVERSTYQSSEVRRRNFRAIRKTGVTIIRQEMRWNEVEKTRGVYDWSNLDSYILDAAREKLQVLPIIDWAPPFYQFQRYVDRPGQTPPANRKAYAAYLRAFAERFGRGGDLWRENPSVKAVPIQSYQIWNEPNLSQFWQPTPNAKNYVKLLKLSFQTIRKVDRRAEIVSAGLPDSRQPGAVRYLKFATQMLKSGGARYFNTLAINPYGVNAKDLLSKTKLFRSMLDRGKGGKKIKIWITEMGWADAGRKSRFRPGAKGMAQRITQGVGLLAKNRKALKIRGVVYYQWRDAPVPETSSNSWSFYTGLLDLNGKRKPAFRAWTRAVKKIR